MFDIICEATESTNHCIASQSSPVLATLSADVLDKWEGFYHAGTYLYSLGTIVLLVIIGAILGRLMFPKNL